MKRRDTETYHAYAHRVFKELGIYDLQGLIHQGDNYYSGIEAYQVKCFSEFSNTGFEKVLELARLSFCEQLDAEYNVIVTSEKTQKHRIDKACKVGQDMVWLEGQELNGTELVNWWKIRQPFNQKKAMYEAKSRIKDSKIDELLFSNSLAWGVNIDGFTIHDGKVNAIIEKRITKASSVPYYDTNIFFNGSYSKSGDYPSWSILWELAKKFNVPLFLMTFDHKGNEQVGLTRIINVTTNGLHYHEDIKPNQQIFTSDIIGIKNYISNFT